MLDLFNIIAAQTTEAGADLNQFQQITKEFGINGKMILAQIINFSLVAFMLWKFAFKPVIATLDERQKKIADGLQFSEEMKNKLAEAEQKRNQCLQQAQQEAQKIINDAKETAKQSTKKNLQDAVSEAEIIIKKAHQSISEEREKMINEAKQSLTEVVIQTVRKVLNKNLSAEEKTAYNKSVTKELAELK